MYAPTSNLLEGIRHAFPLQMMPWDEYFPQMAEADFMLGRQDTIAAKTFFIRKAPFGGSYALLGGITAALRGISELRFDDEAFQYGMRQLGYSQPFLEWLKQRGRIQVKLWSGFEGDTIFPNQPSVTVVGSLPDTRFAEGILTEALNFPTLALTKWYRLVRSVRPGQVLEFGRRRAQHAQKATLYGILAGCFATSHSDISRFFDVLLIGTMGHEWMQSFGDVKQAFDAWLRVKPNKPVGLIDTLQCLQHDFPAWLDAVYEHREAIKTANPPVWGWRNDSGDLAYLTIEQYVRFWKHPISQHEWFTDRMRTVLTNDLDEYTAQSILGQIRSQAGEAGLNAEDILRRIVWAAGTKPSTCDDQPSLGGVAKLMQVAQHACIKLAFDADGLPGVKTSIPGFNRSALIRDRNGEPVCVLLFPHHRYDVTTETGHGRLCHKDSGAELQGITACHPNNPGSRMEIKNYTAEPQQHLIYDTLTGDGFTSLWNDPTIVGVAEAVERNVDSLHWTQTRLQNPHTVKVSLTPDLFELRQEMIHRGVLREDFLTAA